MKSHPHGQPPAPEKMTAPERRACAALALIFALRMLGLFLVLPVFALEVMHYPDANLTRIGLAMGLYGLTQALLQLPLGLASDRFGRKPVIVAGMLVFAGGSVLAALADSLTLLMWGRALQGAGAVSAASMALLADVTRPAVRTKAMAAMGASIGASFALALVLGPLLAAWGGLEGIFWITAFLALLGIAVLLYAVPQVPQMPDGAVDDSERDCASASQPGAWRALLHHADLLRLNLGVFMLHLVQTAMWMGVPLLLLNAGLEQPQHWQVYLPTVLASCVMLLVLFVLERRNLLRVALLGAIALVAVAQWGFERLAATMPSYPLPLWGIVLFLWLFFCGFNVLEASQPSLLSRLAPQRLRGAAMGAYGTLQSLGLFAGGALGGLLLQWTQELAPLFAATTMLTLLWLALGWHLRPPPADGAQN